MLNAIEAIIEKQPELTFLETETSQLTGFEIVRRACGQTKTLFIFLAESERCALEAFQVQAFDYLVCPIDRSRLQDCLTRARKQLQENWKNAMEYRALTALQQHSPREYLERLSVRCGSRVLFIRTEDIDWFEAESGYVKLHADKATHLVRESLNILETKLNPKNFLRIHRCVIVNVERVKEMRSTEDHEHAVILHDGTKLAVGRSYRHRFYDLFPRAL